MTAATTATQVSSNLPEHGAQIVGRVDRCVQNIATLDNSGEQDVLLISTRGKSRLVLDVFNANGGAALTAFKVYARLFGVAGTPASWRQLLGNAAGDYTTPIGPLKYSFSSANAAISPITLAANASALLVLECGGFDEFKVTANTGTATTLTVTGQAS